MRKICVVTGTRAEYGLLSRLMKIIQDDAETQLQVIVTNMHLSPTYGNTYQEIERDGFTIDKKIPILNNDHDDANATVKSMSKALSGFADAYEELNPDLIVLLGDRYEILAAATAALIEKRPIAHLYGGEITEGAYDDAIRHAVTKMSYLHFTSTELYRKRVIQLGENPERVFYVGSIGVENIKKIKLLSKAEIEHSIGFCIDENTILVTYHPVTLSHTSVEEDIDAFLKALEMRPAIRVIFTMPNSDTGGKVIIEKIEQYVSKYSNRTCAFKSLGLKRYLSVMKYCAAVVGNSSSGLVEVPSFGIPTLNIGDRQKGRIAGESVLQCMTDTLSIVNGLDQILSAAFRTAAKVSINPYEKANTAQTIFNIIKQYSLDNAIQKHFYDI